MTNSATATMLFFDDLFLYHRENLTRKVGHPRLVSRFEDPYLEVAWGYPSVFQDPSTGRWRCAYQGIPRSHRGRQATSCSPQRGFVPVICESDDGLNWEIPNLDRVVDLTDREVPHQVMPLSAFGEWSPAFHDTHTEKSAEQFKGLVSLLSDAGRHESRAPLWVSPDGITWTEAKGRSWHPIGIDPIGYPFWNAPRGTYVFTARPSPGDRRIAVYETSDWQSFSKPEIALQADALDSPVALMYGMPVLPYDDYFVGFLWIFHTDPNPVTESPTGDTSRFSRHVARRDHKGYLGRIECELTYSTNGWHFQRGLRDAFIPNTAPGDDGAGQIYPSSFWRTDDYIRIYSSSARYEHGQAEEADGGSQSALLVHELRPDGFVFLESGGGWGRMQTRTLFCSGSELRINVLAPHGEVKLQVTDEFGKPLEGYEFSKSVPFTGDDLSWQPRWRDGVKFKMLEGRLIRLDIRILNGRLYAIRGRIYPVGPLESRSYSSGGSPPNSISSYAR